jgi:hypothetical protein
MRVPIMEGMKPEIPEPQAENPFKLVDDLKKKAPDLWRSAASVPKGRYDRKAENMASAMKTASLPKEDSLVG